LFRSVGDPVLYLSNPKGVDEQIQRDSLDTIKRLNQKHLDVVGDPEIATRINSFELAHSHAAYRAGVDGHFQGIEGDAGNVRR